MPGPPVTVLVAEPGELHEDEAALRLAQAVAGPGLDVRGPNQSRLDLVAAAPGVVNVRIAELERLNRLDPLEVFTVFDGQVVERGDLVASVKVAPHVVEAGDRRRGRADRRLRQPPDRVGRAVHRRRGSASSSRSPSARPRRERFEASVRAKVEGLGSKIVAIDYVEDDADAVEDALGAVHARRRTRSTWC